MKYSRLFVIAFAFFVIACFVSCNGSGDVSDTTTVGAAEQETPVRTELVLVEDGSTDCTVVRTDEDDNYYKMTISTLTEKLSDSLGVKFAMGTDFENPKKPTPADKLEILFGPTVREESVQAQKDLNFNGYIIRVTDYKVVIVGSGTYQVNAALDHFCNVMIKDEKYFKDGRLAFPIGLEIKKELEESESFDVGKELLEGTDVICGMKKIFGRTGKNGFSISQGAACDGEFTYIAMKKKGDDGVETDIILKVDMKTWTVVAESEELPLDHANDMAFDTKGNRLVVTNMINSQITIIDPETLSITETITLPFNVWGLAYIPAQNRFVFRGSGSGYSGIIFTDENFKVIEGTPVYALDETGYTGQGMDADDKYLYIPQSPEAHKRNRIRVYDWEGNFCGDIIINSTNEIETVFNFNGKFYANFNQAGTTVYEIEFFEAFK